MDNLICHTTNCEHNERARCRAGIVNFSEHGICTSKIKREGGILAQTFADIEASDDLTLNSPVDNAVTCASTKCIHNEDGLCIADHIIVEDGMMKTKCFTRTIK